MKVDVLFTTLVLSVAAACDASLQYKEVKQEGMSWVVDGNEVGGRAVQIALPHAHHYSLTLHANTTAHPVITVGAVTLDLGTLTQKTTMTLKFTCIPHLNCTLQIGNIKKIIEFPKPPSHLVAEERRGGRYTVAMQRTAREVHVEEPAKPKSRSGSMGALVTVGVVMGGIVVVVLVSSWRITPTKRHSPDVFLSYLQEPLLPPKNTAKDIPPDIIEEECGRLLWEAVVAGDVARVRSLLEMGCDPRDIELGRTTSALFDAHLLGQGEVLQTLVGSLGFMAEELQEDVIEQVLQEWDKMTRQVFVAAECGMYEHEGGVDALLNDFHLPGTLRDDHGRSLVHYLASPAAMDGRPPWEAKDILKFLTNHEHFINSVDHSGRTALHHLATHPHDKKETLIWAGREWAAEEAWVFVTQLLTQYGCDPRLPDAVGHTAHDLANDASNYVLAEFLQECCEELGGPDEDSIPAILSRAARAAGRGDTSLLKQLLDGRSFLSLAQPTPAVALAPVLVEGVLGGHRGSVLMLLCAGASPLCGAGQARLTPLYAAHHSNGLPAVVPALLRQACSHQLLEEASCPGAAGALQLCLQDLAQRTLAEGARAKWPFKNIDDEAQTEEARELLRTAATVGLPLACRALGQQNRFLHAVPPRHTPVLGAHPSVQAVLLHELDMTPVGDASLSSIAWPSPAAVFRCERELALIEAILESETNSSLRVAAREIIGLLRNEEAVCQEPVQEVMVRAVGMAAQFGLAAALSKMAQHWPSLDLSVSIDRVWGCAAIHVGVLWGHAGVVEMLACLGAGLHHKASGGMSPAHVAALMGEAALLTFLMQHQQRLGLNANDTCSAGLTPHKLLVGVVAWAARRAELTHTETLGVLLLPRGSLRAAEVVRLRSVFLGVNSVKGLTEVSRAWAQPLAAMTRAETEARRLCEDLAAAGVSGELVHAGHVSGSADHLVLLYVMQGCDLTSTTPQTLREVFIDKLLAALGDQQAASSALCAMPSLATSAGEGVTLGWVCAAAPELQLLRLTLVPVVNVTPGPTLADALAGVGVEQGSDVHAVPMSEGWACLPSVAMSAVIDQLEGEWKQTWVTCRFLNQLLEPRWWSPAHISHHTGITPLPDTALASAFLQLLAEGKERWEEGGDIAVLQRTSAVFFRATRGNFGAIWETKDDISPELQPETRSSLPLEATEGTLLYLKELLQTAQKVEAVPRVTFKE